MKKSLSFALISLCLLLGNVPVVEAQFIPWEPPPDLSIVPMVNWGNLPPVEEGGDVHVWPRDKSPNIPSLWWMILAMSEGDTLYLESGTYDVEASTGRRRVKVGPSTFKLIDYHRRIHIRGRGKGSTIIRGNLWLGNKSSIRDLSIINPDQYKPAIGFEGGAEIQNVVIQGGSVGIESVRVPEWTYYFDWRVEYNVVDLLGDIVIDQVSVSDMRDGLEINGDNATITHVTVTSTTRRGISVRGVNVVISDSDISNTGSTGIKFVDGYYDKIMNSTLDSIGGVGIYFDGGSEATIDGVELSNTGSTGILIEKHDDFTIRNSTLDSIGGSIGISIEGDRAEVENCNASHIGSPRSGSSKGIYIDGTDYFLFFNHVSYAWIGIFFESREGRSRYNYFDNIYNRNIEYRD